jgi:hypothetical protein
MNELRVQGNAANGNNSTVTRTNLSYAPQAASGNAQLLELHLKAFLIG